MSGAVIDEQYYQVAQPRSLGERVVIAARDRIYSDFAAACQPTPTSTILDVGVSDVINDAANVLERCHPQPQNITAAGLGDGTEFRRAYPDVAYRKIEPNVGLPFADRSFDIATSNAVLEHVGSQEAQRLLVAELCRVASLVYLTVPHRYFPIEHHTALPLVHYFDATFDAVCKMTGKQEWTDPTNLILMSRARLEESVPPDVRETARVAIAYTGLRLGPFSSNLALIIDRRARD